MSRSSNKQLVPEAKEALNKFKMEAASEVGVNLKQGYNGDLTSKEAGSAHRKLPVFLFPNKNLQKIRMTSAAIW